MNSQNHVSFHGNLLASRGTPGMRTWQPVPPKWKAWTKNQPSQKNHPKASWYPQCLVLAHAPKKTPKTNGFSPEDRSQEKEIPIGNPSFFGGSYWGFPVDTFNSPSAPKNLWIYTPYPTHQIAISASVLVKSKALKASSNSCSVGKASVLMDLFIIGLLRGGFQGEGVP